MTIAIIGAMEEEVALLRDAMEVEEVRTIAHVEFTKGKLNHREVVLLKSGIGKVNVAIATTLLFEHYNIDYVINTGSAGGLHEEANIGDVVISTGTLYHDVDVTGFNYAYGQVPGMPAIYESNVSLVKKVESILDKIGKNYWLGTIGTGDSFINRLDQMELIKKNCPSVIAIEMEAAAVAQVCHHYEKPFIIVRALSDIAGKESHISFNEFLTVAAKESSEMVSELVSMI
ncbi:MULTISPECIES: 5'-methylthioadenosine/S-adenosylhomocysteine nucleosidase [Turicibacter]|uniref:5'-methylthioadenosine/S-adenosylhomocysteine nucleosidase n=1 Tax=Turicibacter faecis TaxID=2963365 RepID=A0ABM8IIK1_9FIRM|nr:MULTISPECIES: 5'-methylthioadenosine/S-adenosylhomocysteine nucleosidase [unclassified Turicibacter]MCU7205224.1 5'-methylthioadenosine/S-adenosylhomocysteine nucleosidase [Turicibacter sp. TA25]MCU7209471.1 5'-methylthioadenosine/S-adenosylhomocysteine nucleosidase [Turicibacter sp. 1E2]NCE79070.1 5'-methylthioadenosine/S-adenosylhomocysteine nucleosidase [Turicibacter sp. TS3]BEH91053.1 5'-methylthioadenosine/S-adenosylhomocysteine nucleosidase [Turicibacter sp. TC023]